MRFYGKTGGIWVTEDVSLNSRRSLADTEGLSDIFTLQCCILCKAEELLQQVIIGSSSLKFTENVVVYENQNSYYDKSVSEAFSLNSQQIRYFGRQNIHYYRRREKK